MSYQNPLLIWVRGLLGYLADIYKIATFNFNNPHSLTKFKIINTVGKKTGSTTFIEAGTFKGITTYRAASVFQKVYTIELDQELAQKATQFLQNKPNVKVIQGDVLDVIPKLLASEEIDNICIFLDGHFSGGITACGDLPEPSVEALDILAKYKDKIKGIIVDDFRCYGTEPNVPSKSDLIKSAELNFGNSGFEISVHLDQVIITRKG